MSSDYSLQLAALDLVVKIGDSFLFQLDSEGKEINDIDDVYAKLILKQYSFYNRRNAWKIRDILVIPNMWDPSDGRKIAIIRQWLKLKFPRYREEEIGLYLAYLTLANLFQKPDKESTGIRLVENFNNISKEFGYPEGSRVRNSYALFIEHHAKRVENSELHASVIEMLSEKSEHLQALKLAKNESIK